ncbi:MAG: ABC transporter substrate-binding protein [Propionibacteriaceae bacterium]
MQSLTRRQFGATAVGVLATAFAVGGCTSASSGGGTKQVTALITHEQGAGFKPFYDGFTQSTGYEFKPTTSEVNALVEQLRIQINSGTAPDVVRAALGSLTAGVLPLAKEGSLADLTDQPWAKNIPASYRALLEWDGRIWAYPTSGQAILMFYNKAVFTQVGVKAPTTWSEFLTVCQTLKDADKIPVAQGLGTPSMAQFIPYMLAASLVSAREPDIDAQMKAGTTSFVKDPGWNEVFAKYKTLMDKGYITPNALGVTLDGAMKQTASGAAAMIPLVSTNSPALFASFPNKADDVGVFALPATDNPDETYVPISPELLALNAKAKNPDGAKAWFQYLSDPTRAADYAKATSSIPILTGSTAVSTELGTVLKPYIANQHFTPFPNHRWVNGDTQQAFFKTAPLLASGEITIPKVLAALDAAYAKG